MRRRGTSRRRAFRRFYAACFWSFDCHLAGGAAILIEPNTTRFSRDLDYFHDSEAFDRRVPPPRRRDSIRRGGDRL
jgi:hypothetical protein